MAYDCEPGGDPRGSWCPRCHLPVREGEPTTRMHIHSDPDGKLGLSGLWHAECARPFWDKMTPTLDRLRFWSSGF